MATKKISAAKTAVKKAAARRPQKPAAAAGGDAAGGAASIFGWLVRPDMSQGWRGWLFRAGMFAIGMGISAVFAWALVVQSQASASNLPVPPFWGAMLGISTGLAAHPFKTLILLLIAFTFGMFVFMPRRFLDKRGFCAVAWIYAVLAIASGFAFVRTADWPVGALFGAAFIVSLIATIASTACYARRIGISGLATFLSFPWGLCVPAYAAYFLDDPQSGRAIETKSGALKKLLDFMLDSRPGQIFLAVLCAAAAIWQNKPWVLAVSMAFALLYFLRGKKWCLANIKAIAWAAAIVNSGMIIIGILAFGAAIAAAAGGA